MRTSLLAVAFALLSAACARADISPDPMSGGATPQPGDKEVSVAMTAEEVELVLSKARMTVKVTFHLENQGGETAFEVGFPLNYKDELKDFAVEVDGKSLPPTLKEQEFAKPYGGKVFTYWLAWDMAFAAGAKKTVVVSYAVEPRDGLLEIDGIFSSEWTEKLGDDDEIEKRLTPKKTGYILVTGAPWKGPIGKAVVTLTLADGLTQAHLRALSPPPTARTATTVEWTFENFEPTSNIEVTYKPGATLDEEIALVRKATENSMNLEADAYFQIYLANLLREKGDAAGALPAYEKILDLFIKTKDDAKAPWWRADYCLGEAVKHLTEDAAAHADKAGLKRCAEKGLQILEWWMPLVKTRTDSERAVKEARVVQVRCFKALGRDLRGMVGTLDVEGMRGRTMEVLPESAGLLTMEEETAVVTVQDTAVVYDATFRLRGKKDGDVIATLWDSLEEPEAVFASMADGTFDNLVVTVAGKPVPVGVVERHVPGGDPDEFDRFLSWTVPAKVGALVEVHVRFTVAGSNAQSGWVWKPAGGGLPDEERRFDRHTAQWEAGGACWPGKRKVSVTIELPKGTPRERIRDISPDSGALEGSTLRWTENEFESANPDHGFTFWTSYKAFTATDEIAWLEKLLEKKEPWADLARFQLALACRAAGKVEDEIRHLEALVASHADPMGYGGETGSLSLESGMYEERPIECYLVDARKTLKDDKATKAAAGLAVKALRVLLTDSRVHPPDTEIPLWQDLQECARIVGDEGTMKEAEAKVHQLRDPKPNTDENR